MSVVTARTPKQDTLCSSVTNGFLLVVISVDYSGKIYFRKLSDDECPSFIIQYEILDIAMIANAGEQYEDCQSSIWI